MAFRRLLECINSNCTSGINEALVNQAESEIKTKKKQWMEFCKDRSPSIDFEIFTDFLDKLKHSHCNLHRQSTKQFLEQVEKEYTTLCDYVLKAENVAVARMGSPPKPVSKEKQQIQQVCDDEEQGPEPLDKNQQPEVQLMSMKQSEQQSVKGPRTANKDKTGTLQDHRAEPLQHINKETKTSAATMTNRNKATNRVMTVTSVQSVSKKDAHHTLSTDPPTANETRSLYCSLFTNNDIMAVAEEYCKLFNEDRDSIYRALVEKYRKGKAEVTNDIFNLVKDIYTYTSRKANEQIQEMVGKTKVIVAGKNMNSYNVSDESIDVLRQFRRLHAMETLSLLKQKCRKPDKIGSSNQDTCIDRFIDRCIELMWCISVHDPPMSLDFNIQFDNIDDLKKAYTPYIPEQQGKRIDYPVWPPLRLSTKGPVVVKGFAHLR